MNSETVEYFSEGQRVRALWRTPDSPPAQPMPAVVQGPGWLGLADAAGYVPYHEALTAAGFGVLSIDYRGFGNSEGERGVVSPTMQLEDMVTAVTYLQTREDTDPEAIGAFGTGGTGGGTPIILASVDDRVRAVVSQFPVADGRDWLRRMRREYEWVQLLADVAEDRRERVLTGRGRLVHPHQEIMVQTPERRAAGFKSDVDDRVPTAVPLATVDAVLAYRPIDHARTLRTPLMVITVENDAVTPTDHALALYEAARGPKELVVQRRSSHYAAYSQYADAVIPRIVSWFQVHVHGPGDVVVWTENSAED